MAIGNRDRSLKGVEAVPDSYPVAAKIGKNRMDLVNFGP
jgi:hypothetical protein